MKLNRLLFSSALLVASVSTLTAQEWRWAADHSFLNPHVDSEAGCWLPSNGPTAFYDIDNNGIDELIVPSDGSFDIIEQTGEFPDITWHTSEENCFEGLVVRDEDFWYHSFILHDLDQDDFPEVIVYIALAPMGLPPELRVFHNQGDFDNPDWIRDDEMFLQIVADLEYWEYLIPQFCDWDGDGQDDLFIYAGYGCQRYERDDDGNWEDLGVIEGLPDGYENAAFNLVDFNEDSVLDLLSTDFIIYGYRRSAVYLNTGTVDEPEMSEPYSLDYFRMVQPFPYDINGDGRPDLTNGCRFMLNTGEDSLEEMWDRPVYWGMSLDPTSVLYDFDNDGVLDLLKGIDLSFVYGGEWRLDQYQLTEVGWKDTPFFGNSLGENTPREWPEYRGLKVVEMFEEGNPCLVKVIYSEYESPRHRLTLLEDGDEGEGWRWRSVDNFFDDVIDTSLIYQTPSFGDLDGDGDQDLAMLGGQHSDSLHVVFYRLELNGREPTWEVQDDWRAGLDEVFFKMVNFADLDGDADLDLVGVGYNEAGEKVPILYRNDGDNHQPEWTFAADAFDNGGPETAGVILTADVNGDGLSDILTGNLCYINETPGSVQDEILTPVLFALNVYPNPFNSAATIRYSIPYQTNVLLGVYDPLGRRIAELTPMDWKKAGVYSVQWDGSVSPSGLYWIVLDAANNKATQSILLVK